MLMLLYWIFLYDTQNNKTYYIVFLTLQFPNLCTQYFKLVSLLAESDAEKFVHLPDDLLKSLTSSVELGLSSYPLVKH